MGFKRLKSNIATNKGNSIMSSDADSLSVFDNSINKFSENFQSQNKYKGRLMRQAQA